MAKQVPAWQALDGTLHETEAAASLADATYTVGKLASDLAENIRPAYSDGDEVARDLLRHADLVLALADAVRAQRAVEEKVRA